MRCVRGRAGAALRGARGQPARRAARADDQRDRGGARAPHAPGRAGGRAGAAARLGGAAGARGRNAAARRARAAADAPWLRAAAAGAPGPPGSPPRIRSVAQPLPGGSRSQSFTYLQPSAFGAAASGRPGTCTERHGSVQARRLAAGEKCPLLYSFAGTSQPRNSAMLRAAAAASAAGPDACRTAQQHAAWYEGNCWLSCSTCGHGARLPQTHCSQGAHAHATHSARLCSSPRCSVWSRPARVAQGCCTLSGWQKWMSC